MGTILVVHDELNSLELPVFKKDDRSKPELRYFPRILYVVLKSIAFSLYPMEDYETSLKLRIQEIRTIIGILFMMETESFSTIPMKSSVPNDEEQ